METTPPPPCDVLIIGAGPTGMVLALWLARLGIAVRLVEKLAEPTAHSRAVGVQARTLEFYAQLGFAEAVVAAGRQVPAFNLWVARRRVGRARLGMLGAGLSPFPFVLIYPQDAHEQLLAEQLRAAGVEIERAVELVDFSLDGDGVQARLRHGDGRLETCAARYLAGCDGAHSCVRDGLGIAFSGGEYAHLFYVADVNGSGAAL
ncbi:MAG: FAD-dependent monooxygenase, partial [Terriglobales bacterium]